MAKVWIADDDLFYRKLISDALSRCGHEVLRMHNAVNVMKLLSEEQPDVLILDVFMAEKNGLELLREMNEVAKEQGRERIPVIVISGDDSQKTELAVRSLQPNSFIVKPFSGKDIVIAVNHILKARQKGLMAKE